MDRSPQPGPSSIYKKCSTSESDENFEEIKEKGFIKKEEKEIDSEVKHKIETNEDEIDKIKFTCKLCGMEELCDYYGNKPPFASKISFLEDCFVMKDPFSAPPYRTKSKAEYFLVLGSKCSICKETVCKDSDCSFFYAKNFCIKCVKKRIKNFPLEVQTKVKKQLTK